jgi:EmrB/QacA subfamily drug resistance transporter
MSPIEAYAARFGSAYKWLSTITVMLGTIVTSAAITMVNVAMPDIMGAFGMGEDQVQWLSTGFLAAMTATMLLTAWVLGRFGYRLAFLGSLVLFMAGSIAGAAASSSDAVILARVLQGMASGLIQPMAMVVLSQVFPRQQRGRAMGIFGIGIVLSPAVGPTLGGVLVDQYSWRYVFVAMVPLCVLAMAAVAVFLPGRDRSDKTVHPFDGFGFVSLSVFLVCLLSGLSNGQRDGWDSDLILSLFAGALASGAAFMAWELTHTNPLLNLRVFASGGFSACCFISFAFGVGIFGSTYLVPMFVQLVQGYTPTRCGLLLMPAGLVLAMVFPLAGHVSDRTPPWLPVMVGLALFGWSNWLCGDANVDTPFWTFAAWIAFGRIGSGLMTPALNAGALRALPAELLAQGSGAVNFVRMLGGALGVNLISVLVDRRTAFHGDALALAMTRTSHVASHTVLQLGLLLAHWGNPFGTRLPGRTPPAADAFMESMLVPQARLFAYQDGFLIVAVLLFVTLLPALLIPRRQQA